MGDLYGPDGNKRITGAPPEGASGFSVNTLFDATSGLGFVLLQVVGSNVMYRLSWGEALHLGVTLIRQSESAVNTAAVLKAMMEMGGLSLEVALEAQRVVGDVNRSLHHEAERIRMAAKKAATEAQQTPPGDSTIQ